MEIQAVVTNYIFKLSLGYLNISGHLLIGM